MLGDPMDRDPLLGRTVADRYRLIARLGAGGMATVYLARHALIDRLSAIKFLHPDLAGDEAYRDRFLREARAVNRINHPNIVEITDYGEADGLVYLVMEYVPGESLQKHLEREKLGFRRAARMGVQIAEALGRAHQMSVIHRDLKPANVLLVARREGGDLVKLTDFGVAKMTDARTITRSTVALGTPGYVAPEYLELGSLDARSDLFALGVLLYEATTGALPFPEHAFTRGLPLRLEPPVPLRAHAPDAPAFFEEVVSTLFARDPDDRPRDGFEAADLLQRVLDGAYASRDGQGPSDDERARAASLPPPRPRGPHLTTVPFDRVGPICVRALEHLESFASSPGRRLSAPAEAALDLARREVSAVRGLADLVTKDADAIETEQAHGRELRARLGARLDELARERSKALGWAGTLAERSEVVRSQRSSGAEPTSAVDAMIWEQAAYDQEEESTRVRADALATEIARLEAETAEENERLEHAMLVATAQLEGHVAALRSIALEAWLSLEDAASRLGAPLLSAS
jgi:serine/threonine-protein kinase